MLTDVHIRISYWQLNPNQLSLGTMRTFWTPERDDELQRHAAAGFSAAKIAILLHTTRGAVLGRSNRLRVSLLGKKRTYWTLERDEELQRHATEGLSAAKIAVLLHTTRAAIHGRSNRLRVSLGKMRTFWTPERDEELQRHAAAGLSAAKIAVLLHTTRGAILGRSNRLRGKVFKSDRRLKQERIAAAKKLNSKLKAAASHHS
jgi:hypothetical protein